MDFGRELFLPWRMAAGEVLYRDLDHVYGPLSQTFNALVFKILGPGIMHLAWVNLALYAVILGLLFGALRSGWGRWPAAVGAAVFVGVFSFGQHVDVVDRHLLDFVVG